MLKDKKTTKLKGNVGIGSAISYFCSNGYVVSLPINDSQKYDLIVEISGQLKKVQVKTTTSLSKFGVYAIDLRTSGGNRTRYKNENFDKNLIDYFYILAESGQVWLIPMELENIKNSANLGKKFEKYMVP